MDEAMYDLMPSPFRGTDSEDINEFLRLYELWVTFSRLDIHGKTTALPLFLKDDAAVWYRSQPTTVTSSYLDLTAALRRRYGLNDLDAWKRIAELWQFRQQPSQSTDDYLTSVERQSQRLGVSAEQAFQVAMNGLRPCIRQHVIQHAPTCIEDLRRWGRLTELSLMDAEEADSTLRKVVKDLNSIRDEIRYRKFNLFQTNPAKCPPFSASPPSTVHHGARSVMHKDCPEPLWRPSHGNRSSHRNSEPMNQGIHNPRLPYSNVSRRARILPSAMREWSCDNSEAAQKEAATEFEKESDEKRDCESAVPECRKNESRDDGYQETGIINGERSDISVPNQNDSECSEENVDNGVGARETKMDIDISDQGVPSVPEQRASKERQRMEDDEIEELQDSKKAEMNVANSLAANSDVDAEDTQEPQIEHEIMLEDTHDETPNGCNEAHMSCVTGPKRGNADSLRSIRRSHYVPRSARFFKQNHPFFKGSVPFPRRGFRRKVSP